MKTKQKAGRAKVQAKTTSSTLVVVKDLTQAPKGAVSPARGLNPTAMCCW